MSVDILKIKSFCKMGRARTLADSRHFWSLTMPSGGLSKQGFGQRELTEVRQAPQEHQRGRVIRLRIAILYPL